MRHQSDLVTLRAKGLNMADIYWTIFEAIRELVPFAAGFAALALIVKGPAMFNDLWRARREVGTNLSLWLFDLLVILPVIAFLVMQMRAIVGPPQLLIDAWAALPLLLVAFVGVVIGDFVGYWRHRFEHLAIIWPSHAVHHSDTELNWFTLYRMHPLNRLTTVMIDVTILTLLGLPLVAVIANNMVRNIWGSFIHSDLPWRLGPLGLILISPVAHRVHHIDDAELSGRNFATVFTVWDRMFGTWHDGKGEERCKTGVEGGSLGFLGELGRPFLALQEYVAKSRRAETKHEPIDA